MDIKERVSKLSIAEILTHYSTLKSLLLRLDNKKNLIRELKYIPSCTQMLSDMPKAKYNNVDQMFETVNKILEDSDMNEIDDMIKTIKYVLGEVETLKPMLNDKKRDFLSVYTDNFDRHELAKKYCIEKDSIDTALRRFREEVAKIYINVGNLSA